MKKILLTFAAIFASATFFKTQELNLRTEERPANPALRMRNDQTLNSTAEKVSTANIHDTLHYFFSKHYYKNLTTPVSAPANLSFLTIKSPYAGAGTLYIDHCGAIFLNTNTIDVHGLEGLVMKNPGSVSSSVGVKLYLCNLNTANLPIMPPLDSVLTSVSNSTAGVWAGGSFTAPVTVTGNFAVLFNIGSTIAGDTVRLFLNNAFTSTASVSVPASQKFGEGFGLFRFNGNFQGTTGAFGGSIGNDYEFVVAPYVSYAITAAAAPVSATICNMSVGSFVNNSGPVNLIENRQFNFNKFKAYWSPTNTLTPLTDSIYNWTFTGSSSGASTDKNPSAFFNVLGNQTAALAIKQRCSTIGYGSNYFSDQAVATISVSNASAPNIAVSGNTAFCTNSSAITTTLFCTGNPTYTWSAPVNSVGPIVVITQTSSSAIYTVMAKNGGCTAVQTVTITKNSIPNVSLSVVNGSICTSATGGPSLTLNGLPSGGVYSGTGVNGPKFVPPNTVGTYSVVYSFTNATTGCTNQAVASIHVANCTGIGKAEEFMNISVFPNPSMQGKITIQCNMNPVKLEVYNMLGVLVYSQQTSSNTTEIDLSGKPDGNYVLKISSSSGYAKTLKIVNQN